MRIPPIPHLPSSRRLLVFGAVAAAAGGAAVYRRASSNRPSTITTAEERDDNGGLGWGAVGEPAQLSVSTRDGATLAVWDVGGGPTVVLPHCWGCSHAIWIPVARRLVESGHRVVLYDQRGHAASTRGTAQLSIQTLADDLAAVLAAREVTESVLAGHSMGGMTIMGLATYRPEVLTERGRALVLVATAAANPNSGPIQAERFASALMASPIVARSLRSPGGNRFIRGVFGVDPVPAQMDLTRTLFADCNPSVRGGFLTAMSSMNLLAGITTIAAPTTIMVGTRDRLTPMSRATQMANNIPGARLVTVEGRGHMVPLEDPDAVADEIIRAVKG